MVPKFMLDPQKTQRRALTWDDLIQRKLGLDDVYLISEGTAGPFDATHAWQEGDTTPHRLLRLGDVSHTDMTVLGRGMWKDSHWDMSFRVSWWIPS